MSVFRFPIIAHDYIFYISPFIPSAKANGISDECFLKTYPVTIYIIICGKICANSLILSTPIYSLFESFSFFGGLCGGLLENLSAVPVVLFIMSPFEVFLLLFLLIVTSTPFNHLYYGFHYIPIIERISLKYSVCVVCFFTRV